MEYKYFSPELIWIEPTDKLRAMHGKTLLVVWSDLDQRELDLHVEPAPPNAPNRGKIAVLVVQLIISGLEESEERVTMLPTTVPKYGEAHRWQQSLTQHALSLIRPRSSEWPEHIDYVLVIPDGLEPFGR